MDILTGGKGRKYRVYALASRLVIAATAEANVCVRRRRGRYSAMGRRGRTSRRCVYVEVVRVSCVESFWRRLAWSVEGEISSL